MNDKSSEEITRGPSDFALELLEKMRKAASQEVEKHLEAGRSVVGIRNGEIVTIHPKGK